MSSNTGHHGRFAHYFQSKTLMEVVRMNDVKFQSFTEGCQRIGTRGLRGCYVILIGSRLGAIIAHIGPASIDAMLPRVAALYAGKRQAYFQGGQDAWMVMARVIDDSVIDFTQAVQGGEGYIRDYLRGIGIPHVSPAGYEIHAAPMMSSSMSSSPEFPDKGCVVAGILTNPVRPEAWIENRLLHWWE